MRGIQTLAAGGTAVNLGFAVGGWNSEGGLPSSPMAIVGLVIVMVLAVAPYGLAYMQGGRRGDQVWAQRLIAGALILAVAVAVFAYMAALRDANRSGLIFVFVPAFQLILVAMALVASDFLERADS